MLEDRRRAPRARVPGARIKYESKPGERQEAPVLNLGKGGLFIQSDAPMPVGKRLWIEIEVSGEHAPWQALGRVLWVRERADGGDDRPPGMGVTFVDIDDEASVAIDRVVLAQRGLSETRGESQVPTRAAPARERTVLGVGLPAPSDATESPSAATAAPSAPVAAQAPPRERTVLGVGMETPKTQPQAPIAARSPNDIEEENAWEPEEPPQAPQAPKEAAPAPKEATTPAPASPAVHRVPASASSAQPKHAPVREASVAPAAVRKRGGASWLFVLVVAAAAGGGFVFRDRLRASLESSASDRPTPPAALPANASPTPAAPSVTTAPEPIESAKEPVAPPSAAASAAVSAPSSAAPTSSSAAGVVSTRATAPVASTAAGSAGSSAHAPPTASVPRPTPSGTARSSTDNPY